MAWRRARRFPAADRSGDAWRVPADQAWAEEPVFGPAQLGRGWRTVPLLNNEQVLDPHGTDEASEAVRAARGARRLTALDDGQAWRRHRDGVLLVARVEVFADPEGGEAAAHRQAWVAHGTAALDATWRERWRERAVTPGWVEARWRQVDERPGPLHGFRAAPATPPASLVDWITVEDHTDPSGGGDVTCYQHLTVWQGRATTVVTLRHPLGEELDEHLASLAAAVASRPGP